MRIIKTITTLFLVLNLASCKGTIHESDSKSQDSQSYFSSIEKFRHSKSIGQIINDYDTVFNASEKQELFNILYDYDKKTTRQIVVVTVNEISPYTDIQKYATDLGNYWGVGTKEKNNGLTIVFCQSIREIGIATGLGTQKILTNDICKNVIDSIMIPEFKDKNYYSGIKKGVIELISKWKQEQ